MNLTCRNEEGSMEQLLRRGANPDLQNNTGQTSLHITVGKGSSPCTQLLIEKNASVNIKVIETYTHPISCTVISLL